MKTKIAAAVLMVFAFAALGFGQTDSTLVGNVVDASGAAIPNANLELTNTATGVKYSTKTTTAGDYRFSNVPIGRYDLAVTASGFSNGSVKGLDLALNAVATANVKLQVGS